MSFLSTLGKDIKAGVSDVASFFDKLFTEQTWQNVFKASVQTLASYTEQILESLKNDPAAASIASLGQQVLNSFGTLTGLVSGYNSATHATFVSQVQTILSDIQGNLSSILAMVDVKNSALITTVTTIADLVITGLQALLALIPQPATTSTSSSTTAAVA